MLEHPHHFGKIKNRSVGKTKNIVSRRAKNSDAG